MRRYKRCVSIQSQELNGPADQPAVLAFIDEGWRSFFVGQPWFNLEGFVHGPAEDEDGFNRSDYGIARVQREPNADTSDMQTASGVDPADPGSEETGGWFYRDLP